ncbi:MAG: IS1595 family transposase [Desulfovibrio sp.]|uniref:IS1595 family transposase n=1 Tax=Desulfovibrio sp. TaxID=885 RepID=UPI001A7B31DE|nr:IS1595 family transposase [Desulfovibrio sp.]MBD5417611.1 IS1595 family transposase [Desulfovibrio sp.]
MYERRSRLNSRQQAELIKFFVAGATARAAGEIAGVNRNIATSYFMRLRRLIAMHLPSYRLSGEVEADESYFGGVRKGKRGRENSGFRITEAQREFYTAIIPNARTETLMPIIEERVEADSIVYTDMFRAYNALDVGDFHHHRIDHSRLFAKQGNHVNERENFWNQAKRYLRKFIGIKPEHFYWFLKECEWRFNGGNHKELLTQLNSWVKEAKH